MTEVSLLGLMIGHHLVKFYIYQINPVNSCSDSHNHSTTVSKYVSNYACLYSDPYSLNCYHDATFLHKIYCDKYKHTYKYN